MLARTRLSNHHLLRVVSIEKANLCLRTYTVVETQDFLRLLDVATHIKFVFWILQWILLTVTHHTLRHLSCLFANAFYLVVILL